MLYCPVLMFCHKPFRDELRSGETLCATDRSAGLLRVHVHFPRKPFDLRPPNNVSRPTPQPSICLIALLCSPRVRKSYLRP